MIYWCFLSGYILISWVRQTLQVTATCRTVGTTGDGLKEVFCDKPGNVEDSVLPNNIPYDVEVLRLFSLVKLEIDVNTFSQFYDLKRVIIERSYFIDRNWIKKSQEWFDNMHKTLFADTNILEITLVECFLKDENVLTFPSVIRVVNFTNNQYSKIDLRGYEDLEEVTVAKNLLNSFPQFTDPSPSIRYLNLRDNDYLNITVNDIAPLCSLKKLELSVEVSLNTLQHKCECERMTNWTDELNITITGLDNICFPDEYADCSSYTLDEVRKKHQNCVRSNTGLPYVHRVVKRYFYKILTGLAALLILLMVIYAIYKISSGTSTEEWAVKRSSLSSFVAEENEVEDEEE